VGGKSQVVKQLKVQLDDAEHARTAALRAKRHCELEVEDLQQQLEGVSKARGKLEEKFSLVIRENAELASRLQDGEEETAEVMKKYRASVAAMGTDQITLQDQAAYILELETERGKLKERVGELENRLEQAEEGSQGVEQGRRAELKLTEMGQRLELEVTNRQRLEGQVARLKEARDKLEKESEEVRYQRQGEQEKQRRLLNQLRDLKEDYLSLQGKEADVTEKRNVLEKRLEIAESETVVAKTELQLALKRIEDFQMAISSDMDSDSGGSTLQYLSDEGEEELENFLEQHRRAMSASRERESQIRESIAREIGQCEGKDADSHN